MSRMRKRRNREARERTLSVEQTSDEELMIRSSERTNVCYCGGPVAGCPVEDDCPANHLCLPHYLEDAEERGVLLHG